MTHAVRLVDVVAELEALYDPRCAESWDAVGLVCGDPDARIHRVLLAVDPVGVVADEALEWGADLLLVHHPLLLRAVHGVPATDPKGQIVHRLITGGIALYVAHTNADVANPGVSDALARRLGLIRTRPLAPSQNDPHGRQGLGRVGELPVAVSLRGFTERAAAAIPATAGGLRVAGDPDQTIRTVAVCGGSGDSLFDAARAAGADVFITADLRHHPASEFREHGGPALVDAAHWATEWPWLADAASDLEDAGRARSATVETRVSARVTDPWTFATTEDTSAARQSRS
ncbi:MAG: Nif3-like dinuclear metal center hexameric protein [Streptosporangiaceae bacterium]